MKRGLLCLLIFASLASLKPVYAGRRTGPGILTERRIGFGRTRFRYFFYADCQEINER